MKKYTRRLDSNHVQLSHSDLQRVSGGAEVSYSAEAGGVAAGNSVAAPVSIPIEICGIGAAVHGASASACVHG